MSSNSELIFFTLLFCFAVYVRLTNNVQQRTKLVLKKDLIDEPSRQNRLACRKLTQQYSSYPSVPSLTSDNFSDDETLPYDATYCISSDMPFSIPGKLTYEKQDSVHNKTFNHLLLNRSDKDHIQ